MTTVDPLTFDSAPPLPSRARLIRLLLLACVLGSALAGCGLPRNKAPVEDRSNVLRPVTPPPLVETPRPTAPAPATVSNAEYAGRSGYYTVRPGDTLIRVGLETGQNWRDIQRWNNLDNPNLIEVGQVLRVLPPGQDAMATTVRPIVLSRIETRAPEAKPASAAAAPAAAAPAPASASPTTVSPVAAATAAQATPAAAAPVATREADDEMSWAWPAQGPLVSSFDETRNKGVAIAGKAGEPVMAAADGRVVYAGSGLRGYGNLIIIKHNDTYLTAYAHNQALLVKEDQPVRRGQKIAEMGSSDAERVQLHFEIRRKGKPIDPTRVLPGR
ncbi:MAG: lipoprotein NlpD [Pseudomonadota bacterium]|jgi:lipoprotein NlpD